MCTQTQKHAHTCSLYMVVCVCKVYLQPPNLSRAKPKSADFRLLDVGTKIQCCCHFCSWVGRGLPVFSCHNRDTKRTTTRWEVLEVPRLFFPKHVNLLHLIICWSDSISHCLVLRFHSNVPTKVSRRKYVHDVAWTENWLHLREWPLLAHAAQSVLCTAAVRDACSCVSGEGLERELSLSALGKVKSHQLWTLRHQILKSRCFGYFGQSSPFSEMSKLNKRCKLVMCTWTCSSLRWVVHKVC